MLPSLPIHAPVVERLLNGAGVLVHCILACLPASPPHWLCIAFLCLDLMLQGVVVPKTSSYVKHLPTIFGEWQAGDIRAICIKGNLYYITVPLEPPFFSYSLSAHSQHNQASWLWCWVTGFIVVVWDHILIYLFFLSLNTNRSAVGIGEMLVSSNDVSNTGMKGKGMRMLHLVQDKLW